MTLAAARNTKLPFGIYTGSTLAEISQRDHPYLLWLAAHVHQFPEPFRAPILITAGQQPATEPEDTNQTSLGL